MLLDYGEKSSKIFSYVACKCIFLTKNSGEIDIARS